MLKNLVPNFKVLLPLDLEEDEASSSKASVKETVIRRLVDRVRIKSPNCREELIYTLLSREAKGSTGLGRSIAIPHARTECIEKPVIVLGVSNKGIDWEAQDSKDVFMFFLILVPLEQSDLYLRILTRLTSLVRQPGFVEALQGCRSEEDALDLIHDFELKLKLKVQTSPSKGNDGGQSTPQQF